MRDITLWLFNNFSEEILTLVAGSIELGLPVTLIIFCIVKPATRAILLLILGSITPMVLFYICVIFSFIFFRDEASTFSFYAMWIMTLWFYCLLAILGVITGWIIRNRFNNAIRFCIGFMIGPIVFATLIGLDIF